ncbi:methyltransferase family protein [Paenibacillus marinisediminis]
MLLISGLIVWCLFYGSYMLKMLLQRQKGISTNRMGKGTKERKTFIIESVLKAATYALAAVQIISILLDTSLVSNPTVRWAGIGIALLGTIVFITAMSTMKSSWRAGVDETQQTNMITTGIYRFSRNPAFLGFDLLYIGLGLAYSNIALILLSVLTIVMLHLQILEEERFLPKAFGNEYIEYKHKTGRYFWLI